MAKKRNLDGTIAKGPGGRPTVFTPETVNKLEQAFAIDCTVEEACSYAEITRQSFYEHIKRNPEFSDRIDDLRQRPILKARQTIVKSLYNPQQAQWYLERKVKKEFTQRSELTGADGEALINNDPRVDLLLEAYGRNTKDTKRRNGQK